MFNYNEKDKKENFIFTSENFKDPKLPKGLNIIELQQSVGTEESLKGYGYLLNHPNEFTVENNNFEINYWPVTGWRKLDPNTGNEGGTTEGNFEVHWKGDYYYGKNLAISSINNSYLDGLGVLPEYASHDDNNCNSDGNSIHLWMSDYHPDGGQLFFPLTPIPFTVTLGLNIFGDDIKPTDMKTFYIPAGKGVYIHPGTWHNGVYITKEHSPATFLTRQGKVHARISCSWAVEFKVLLKVSLLPPIDYNNDNNKDK